MVTDYFWKNKKVLVTGHTGFKGSWLATWLINLEAEVYGYALDPYTMPSLFNQLNLSEKLHHKIADIRNKQELTSYIKLVQPHVIFHMAAQPLVRESYKNPVYTWETNVMGTVNLLEALKEINHNCAVVVITTDKVYENQNTFFGYRETDNLGGYDPYSSSKAATELAVNSWRNSFFLHQSNIKLASARAGNVIGGGDWSDDRIVPDLIRAIKKNDDLEVRNPNSTRPWQHVLEPLSGYMTLAEALYEKDEIELQSAFNFGPLYNENRTVKEVIEESFKTWKGTWIDDTARNHPHEMHLLNVAIDKALNLLNWKPKWNFNETIFHTMIWYKSQHEGKNAFDLTLEQINLYQQS